MNLKTLTALDMANGLPAKAGTPNCLKALGQLEAEIQQGMRYGVPPSGGGVHANTINMKTFYALDTTDAPPAEAGTPNLLPHGVPPSGGETHANTMTPGSFNALEIADTKPAKAGTPCGAEIQQGMKELEGMLR